MNFVLKKKAEEDKANEHFPPGMKQAVVSAGDIPSGVKWINQNKISQHFGDSTMIGS